MSDLTTKFTGLETQLAEQATTMGGYVDTVEAKLQAIFDQLDIQILNNAANTRYLLAAIGNNSPCVPCPTPAIVIPPTDETTEPINEDRCKRSQAFVHFMQEVFTVLDVASSVGIGFNWSLVTDAFNQVITSIGGSDSPPVISFPEAVRLTGSLINYVALNLLRGDTLSGAFAPLVLDMRDGLYATTTAAAAMSEYATIIGGSSAPSDEQSVMIDAAYTGAFNYFFDPASMPDLSGYSGTACGGPGPGECVTLLTDENYTLTKTDSGGSDYKWYEVPSWADSIQYSVNVSSGINILFSDTAYPNGTPATPLINAAGCSGFCTGTWSDPAGSTRYFGIGGFFAGLPNGSTVDFVINSLVACVAE